jgi:hypothetical protein
MPWGSCLFIKVVGFFLKTNQRTKACLGLFPDDRLINVGRVVRNLKGKRSRTDESIKARKKQKTVGKTKIAT